MVEEEREGGKYDTHQTSPPSTPPPNTKQNKDTNNIHNSLPRPKRRNKIQINIQKVRRLNAHPRQIPQRIDGEGIVGALSVNEKGWVSDENKVRVRENSEPNIK